MATRLTIWFTSDTHGYLYPTTFADDAPRPMGLLSMRFPKDGNTLIIDGGDTTQGSPLTYRTHALGLPCPAADALNELGYDYVTLGNHDFNYGRAALADYLRRLHARCLCANVTDGTGELPIFPAEVRVLANGLRVGLVGIVTDWVNLWEKPENLAGLTVGDPLEAARRALAGLRADVLIGIYHGGLERDLASGRMLSDTGENIACRLCEELPFDLLLTGHQHIALGSGEWHGVHLVQTPCNAAACARIEMDAAGAFRSELLPVTPAARLSPMWEKLLADTQVWLDAPVGHLSRALWPEDKLTMALRGSPIADLFNAVQLEASGADVSCTALGNELRGFDRDVTVRDVVASYVYANTLVVLRVTGGVLRAALEQCARYFAVTPDGRVSIAASFLLPKEAHYNYDYFAGIEYAFDLTRAPGSRVTRLTRGGAPLADDAELTLCLNSYRATGAGDFGCYAACPRVREIQTEISELILDYFARHPCVDIPDTHPFAVRTP